jgi:ferritin-like metal-binding protein YciE
MSMAETQTLHDAFIDEIRDAYDAEKQLIKALPKMAKAATSPELKAAFENHLEETRGQVERLEEVFSALEEKVQGKHCDGIEGILEEGDAVMEDEFDELAMDACLIAAGQRAEHYEVAAYGSLVAWARSLGHPEVADLLELTLNEEKAADAKLTALAEGGINDKAATLANEDDEEGSEEETPVAAGAPGRSTAKKGTGPAKRR